MFEIEVDHTRLNSEELPPDIRKCFLEQRSITHLGPIKWEEHCTECAWPDCYTSCDLYNPRNDGHCRRTIDGFSPLVDMRVLGNYVVRVKFKRWGHISAQSQTSLRPATDIARTESRLNALSSIASRLPTWGAVIGRPGLPSRLMRRLKNRSVGTPLDGADDTQQPNCFLMEIYNPISIPVALSLVIAPRGQGPRQVPFTRLLHIEPGFQRLRIPFDEIQPHLNGAHQVDLSINPNILHAEEEGLTLYFGVMAFTRDTSFAPAQPTSSTKKIKVVIWDLDNTVWDGTLIEDGPGTVTLRPGIRETIMALDSRGILNSIASKNHEADAIAELERFGLREYFVFPVIGWGRKSEAVRRITQSFNVGEDTIAFVDDQPFERDEVRSGNPKVRLYGHDEAIELLQRNEFDVPVTGEALNRRSFYQNEEVRQQAMQQSGGGYLDFLKCSNIRAHITEASVAQIERIHELVQRTNQMNFSGRRYTKQDLAGVLSSQEHESYLIDAEDNYGKYGYIGFAVVHLGKVPRVVDLAFSCRVQSKRIEHAVLIFLMKRYATLGSQELEIFYHATDRNAQIAQVFSDLGCRQLSHQGTDFVYGYDSSSGLPANDIVSVTFSSSDKQLEPVVS